MPIFIERHDLSCVTAEDIAKVHLKDLKTQDQYGCRALTYWYDEKRGTAFCLVDAPDQEAVKKMHNNSYGKIPNQILEIDAGAVDAFLGRIENPDTTSNPKKELKFINESALRTILILRIEDFQFLKLKIGKVKFLSVRKTLDDILLRASTECYGNEIKKLNDCIIYSFESISHAMSCVAKIRQELKANNEQSISNLKIKTGICSGEPADHNSDLFGKTLLLARRMCAMTSDGFILAFLEETESLPTDFESKKIVLITPIKEKFLDKLMDTLESNWDKAALSTKDLGQKLGLSKSGFYRQISKICQYSPHGFIKEYRLQKAVESIEKQEGSISEIAYRCGFNSPSYFSKCFLGRFGVLPSAFAGIFR